jgi:ribosomal protein S12 methylthiotransferase
MGGYDIVPTYEGADVVVVNTCGFIDSAKQESLDIIGEAISKNGRVIVTGCMGKGNDAQSIMQLHPKVLSVTGPAAYEEVVSAVHEYLPYTPVHDPFAGLVPPQSVKLTPRHYAYRLSLTTEHQFCFIVELDGEHTTRHLIVDIRVNLI